MKLTHRAQGVNQCWRYDPDRLTHRNFDFYASFYSPVSETLVRVALCQITMGKSHGHRPGEYYKTAEKFKDVLSKRLGCGRGAIEVIVLLLSPFNNVSLTKEEECGVTSLDKVQGNNLIFFVNLNNIDKEAITPSAQKASTEASTEDKL